MVICEIYQYTCYKIEGADEFWTEVGIRVFSSSISIRLPLRSDVI